MQQLFDSLCAISNEELLLLRILENSHLNSCQRTIPSASQMTASIEEFLPVFCKSKVHIYWFLVVNFFLNLQYLLMALYLWKHDHRNHWIVT